jgi:hypothetical protein
MFQGLQHIFQGLQQKNSFVITKNLHQAKNIYPELHIYRKKAGIYARIYANSPQICIFFVFRLVIPLKMNTFAAV